MKKQKSKNCTIFLIVVIIFLSSMVSPTYTVCSKVNLVEISNKLNDTVQNELNHIDFSDLNNVLIEFEKSNTNVFGISNIKTKIYQIISGENAVNYSNFISSIFSILIQVVISYLPILSVIVSIGVISNLLGGIKSKFNEKSTSDLIHLVCFMAVVVMVIGMISTLAKNTGQAIDNMVGQMNIIFPILLTLMAGTGATASVGVFQPIVAIISTYVADFFKYIIMPMFMFSFVFGIISNLSNNVKLDRFNHFISSLFKWCVGIIFTLFFAIFAIQGISAGSFDSLSIRTTKYTIKSYVPVMGGYLSDGMDLILSSTILIKNATGLVGILLVITTILVPLFEIVIFSLIFKLISAILQPMGNVKISNFLMSTSKSVTMLSTCIIAIGFMYLLSVGLIMTATNLVV